MQAAKSPRPKTLSIFARFKGVAVSSDSDSDSDSEEFVISKKNFDLVRFFVVCGLGSWMARLWLLEHLVARPA
jgi:hypothetical protein